MAREERGDVAGEDREQHREHCEASVPRNGAEQEHVRESEPDPPSAENRRRDRNGRRLPRVSDPVQEERETDRREEACDRPFGPAELRAEQREKGSDVRGKHERPQASDQQAVLVQRKNGEDHGEREQPPAAEIDDAENERQTDHRDRDARPQVAHRPRLTDRRSDAFGLHSPRARHGDPRR